MPDRAGGLPWTRRRQPRWGWGWEAGRSRLGLTGRGRTLVASHEARKMGRNQPIAYIQFYSGQIDVNFAIHLVIIITQRQK